MAPNPVHEEDIRATYILVATGAVAIVFLLLTVGQWIRGGTGSNPAPIGYFIAAFVVSTALGWWLSYLRLRIDRQGVCARLGPFKKLVRWSDIEACHILRGQTVNTGVHLARYQGRWATYYTVLGQQQLAVVTRAPGPLPLIVTTRRPDEAMAAANVYLGRRRRGPS